MQINSTSYRHHEAQPLRKPGAIGREQTKKPLALVSKSFYILFGGSDEQNDLISARFYLAGADEQ